MLSHSVHFSCPADLLWPELGSSVQTKIPDEKLSAYSGGILNSWIVRTAYELKLRGAKISIGPGLRRDSINLASVRDFGRRDRDPHAFVVIPRGDAHAPALADFTIEQNSQRGDTSHSVAIPHWPQPGILPRDATRRDRVEVLTFKGRTRNLDPGFRNDNFRSMLSKEGIRLELDTIEGLRGQHSWNDYRSADAVLAVRNLTLADARSKPASKLVNAWFAEVPALLGPEPAFIELRRGELDFLEVRTPEDALNTLKRLNNNPVLYRAIVENGRKRRVEYTEEVIASRWIEVLNGPVALAFEKWRRESKIVHTVRYARMCLSETAAKRDYQRKIKEGPRLLG